MPPLWCISVHKRGRALTVTKGPTAYGSLASLWYHNTTDKAEHRQTCLLGWLVGYSLSHICLPSKYELKHVHREAIMPQPRHCGGV